MQEIKIVGILFKIAKTTTMYRSKNVAHSLIFIPLSVCQPNLRHGCVETLLVTNFLERSYLFQV
ncbi:hypothetical protein JZ751_013377 [Albula glossodonta]|uniref:Uncharacterized protein n=1 Tax=Albula glossodonta TaxID=121402 RepID=A0A8T2MN63_9TELE|nr:hypothetical protein JZ751_013377 [Albula glossodonta]